MLVACWSAKGGAGTTVVTCSLSLVLARAGATPLAVDLAGDVSATFGIADPPLGVGDWLAAEPGVGADALHRLAVDGGAGVAVIGPGAEGDGADARAAALACALRETDRPVVVDCGVLRRADDLGARVAAAADVSLLVTRPCYVGLRRALAAPVRPSAVVLVAEPERALGRRDVADVLGVPVLAEIPIEPGIARAADAGLLATRLPRAVERALESVLA